MIGSAKLHVHDTITVLTITVLTITVLTITVLTITVLTITVLESAAQIQPSKLPAH